MLRETVLVCAIIGALSAPQSSSPCSCSDETEEWWRDSFIYQIYPRSWKDSDGDGIGDLNGITSKLSHLKDLGVSGLWLSPVFTSPMVDFGYDIANFTDIDPIYGNLDGLTKLTAKAHSLNLKVILDWVPNHSSDEHPWFAKSIEGIKPYDEYYVWKDALIVNGTRQPPNNWLSVFLGSAWEWNERRQQYYLHQFAVRQPDLNYRSAALRKEMEDAILFWVARGIDGFRIDSLAYVYEDAKFRDNPVVNYGLPADDPDRLATTYTKDLPETYDLLQTWRDLLDAQGGSKKILLTEVYTTLPLQIKYYHYGSNVPFNFMFVVGLNNQSTALDFKRSIDEWTNSMPKGDYVANWVVDNHDNKRTSARFGIQRADQIGMLASILPGIGVLYNGDEIGMEDTPISWKDTVDTQGCSAGPDRYAQYSRDPERTPFQWDNSTSAGFSTSPTTWLPVNSNYKTVNLEAEKLDPRSHYSVFKKLVAAKKLPAISKGSSEVILATENVLSVIRRLSDSPPVVLLINFLNTPVTVDAAAWLNIPQTLRVYTSSVGSRIPTDVELNTTKLTLPGAASVILH
ncbi:alpha-glucosidase-like [Diachasmimorpha longicaudata]|uniref:alpha-glucosidase-like n=1 Tax=Diachasmimorpha longicaudata TaxID=58733 RepID=UPI0030B89110